MGINDLVKAIHQNAVDHGFWEKPNFAEKVALIHSELSEALEADRQPGVQPSDKLEGVTAVAEELADAVIRIFDLCGHLQIDLEKVVLAKMAYNASRPHLHGKRY